VRDTGVLLAGALAIFAAGLLRGLTGFGFAIAAVPLLSLVMRPALAVSAVLCLLVMGGLLDVRRMAGDTHWPSLRWLLVGALAGSPLGVLALSVVAPPVARLVIAGATAIAVVLLGAGLALRAIPGAVLTVLIGGLAGLSSGLAAMPGPPVIAYYLSAPLDRATVRASLLMFFLGSSIISAATATWLGLVDLGALALAVLALPPMFVGTRVGLRLTQVGSEAAHRRIAIACLAAIAVATAAKGIGDLI
jgi:uncharacterized membrane protein YfcA